MGSYDLDGGIKSFAVDNEFTRTLNKVSYKLGKDLVPFCILGDEYQKKHNLADLAEFGGFEDSSKTLIDDVYTVRKEVLQSSGIGLSEDDNLSALKKTIFFQYLMTVSICYVEVEKWKTTNGVSQPTYNKFLCTRNPALMGAWMGMDRAEMQAKYSAKIKATSHELMGGRLRFVKLNQSAKGNSITVPRIEYTTEKMRCVPLFMLYAFTEGFKTRLLNGIVEFTFLKDNHTERKMCSTLSEDIMSKFYNDSAFVRTALSGIDINTVKQGGMILSSKANRGYIKLPELGSSIYDSTGTRSLNIARILACKEIKEDEVDTSYINVSLDCVVTNFQDSLEYCGRKNPDALVDIYKEIMEEDAPKDSQVATLINDMVERVISNETLLSTEYRRYLHTFMVSNPQWFPLYTGIPSSREETSMNFGVQQMDF